MVLLIRLKMRSSNLLSLGLQLSYVAFGAVAMTTVSAVSLPGLCRLRGTWMKFERCRLRCLLSRTSCVMVMPDCVTLVVMTSISCRTRLGWCRWAWLGANVVKVCLVKMVIIEFRTSRFSEKSASIT